MTEQEIPLLEDIKTVFHSLLESVSSKPLPCMTEEGKGVLAFDWRTASD